MACAHPTLRGTASPYGAISVYVDGHAVGTAYADRSGNWSYRVEGNLGTGEHSIQAQAQGGNSAMTEPIVIHVDTHVPTPTVPVIGYFSDDVGTSQGNFQNGATTDDRLPTIHGAADPNTWVTISIDGVAKSVVYAGANGQWTYTPWSALSDG